MHPKMFALAAVSNMLKAAADEILKSPEGIYNVLFSSDFGIEAINHSVELLRKIFTDQDEQKLFNHFDEHEITLQKLIYMLSKKGMKESLKNDSDDLESIINSILS